MGARQGGAHAAGLLAEDRAHAAKELGTRQEAGPAKKGGIAHCWLPEAAKPRLTTTFSSGECAATACCCFCSASSAAMDIMPAGCMDGTVAGASLVSAGILCAESHGGLLLGLGCLGLKTKAGTVWLAGVGVG